jgi:hypothetical protein
MCEVLKWLWIWYLAAEWKCFTVVLELAANHVPLQGVGDALYPNKWYLSPLHTPFVGVVCPLRQCHDWLNVSQVVWTQVHVHWWMTAHTYRQWIVWRMTGAWRRGLVISQFICGSSNSACQKFLLQCQILWWLMNCELEMMLKLVVVA